MQRIGAALAIAALVSGCATGLDSPNRFVGKPVAEVVKTMPKYGRYDLTDKKGRPYYRWNFDAVEKVSVQRSHVNSYGINTGLSFGNELRQQRCSVTAYYDPVTLITTDFIVRRAGGGKCNKMNSYLDGRAFQPTDFPG